MYLLFKIMTKSLGVPIQEQCSQYWPESKNSPEKMGSQLSVELLSEGEFEDYICRELKITDLTVRTMPSLLYYYCDPSHLPAVTNVTCAV